ncbi:MAG: DEAD/DEAH box helicase [Planctomycetales bacterium]|nr:DEAD/DEAH box helicase [Planctomycetales bacterium]
MITFASLALTEPLQRALAVERYETPTPIQAQAIPLLLAGRDVLGCAQTGTGKTAAFALPVLQHLAGRPGDPGRPRIRALVLTPTRELAAQIGESFAAYGRFLRIRHAVIFGGVNENPQIAAVRRGIDVLVATPGRLLDLHGRDHVDLRHVEFFVLDEADRMLDMGFIHDVKRVIRALPPRRQNLLFSATLPVSIRELAAGFLRDPVRVEVAPPSTTVELIEQFVMFVARAEKPHRLAASLREDGVGRALVFTRTKHGANRLAGQLEKMGLHAAAIHGNKSQAARTRALEGFRRGDVPVLIATDLASRGLDIDAVSHVFNYDIPNIPESYVHRIGRTARAGQGGVAISLCDPTETGFLRDIERTIGRKLRVVGAPASSPAAAATPAPRPQAPVHRPGPPRHLPAPSPPRPREPAARAAGASPTPPNPPPRAPVSGGWKSFSRPRRRRR